jgi:methionine synthase I (cobalamin-dependent)
VVAVNEAAARLARAEADAAPHTVVVAGSMGPTGQLLEPLGAMTYEQAVDAFAEQAGGLAAGGADLIWVETMSDLEEVRAALEGAHRACDLPVVATMSFDTHGRTMMGVTPEKALHTLRQFDLVALGANCGANLPDTEAAIAAMHAAAPNVVLVAKANAGIPHWESDRLVYDGTPEVMAGYARRVRGLGARLIGTCCGSTAEHIRAISEALAEPGATSEAGPGATPEAGPSSDVQAAAGSGAPDKGPRARRRQRARR